LENFWVTARIGYLYILFKYTMKQILSGLILSLGIVTSCFAQDGEILKKNLSDTVLSPTRLLDIPGAFDGQKVLQQLFPGKYYNLSSGNYNNELISWECKNCKTLQLIDMNEESTYAFPYEEGVATRLLNVMTYKDSSGTEYKMLAFNHSWYDADGAQTSRFTGGTLGRAKFTHIGNVWSMKFFQPAIGAWGAFSSCPTPKPVLIGHDQYAFMLVVQNGPGGGPFYDHLFLIAGTGGAYKQVMATYGVGRTKSDDEGGSSEWTYEYSVPESEKRFFRDILVTIKGEYVAGVVESLSDALQAKIKAKGKKKGHFKETSRYVFKWGKGYQLQGTPEITVE